jgi:aspartyl-tRNA(Asn)/glutamyl-tRNA(Gln) amidotransferase subunit C
VQRGPVLLTKDAVQHIAKLSRLRLSEKEAEAFSHQLSAILDSFNELAKVKTDGVEPLVTPSEIQVHMRVDEVVTEENSEELLKNAPSRAGNLFKVPPVV